MACLSVFIYASLPMAIMFLIGYLLDKHFSLDVHTYDIVTRYAVMPLFIFLSLYRHIPSHVTLIPAAFAGILCLSGLLGWLLQKILPEEGTIRDFISPFMLSDTELTGVVFLILVFSHVPYFTGMGNPKTFIIPFVSVASLLLLTSMIIHSVLLAGRRTHSLTEMIRAFFSVPSLYTAVAAVLLRSFNIPLEHSFLWPVLLHYDGVFVILTCIMTGIWFHKSYSPEFKWAPALLMLVRFVLILGISYAVIHFSGIFSPAESQVLFIAASIPAVIALTDHGTSTGINPTAAFIQPSLIIYLLGCPLAAVLARVLFPVI